MDVQMPEMDGLEAARRIRDEWPPQIRPRIIAMTANALRGDREACLEAGMDDYLSKPILIDALRQALLRASLVSRDDRREPWRPAPATETAAELPILETAALDSLFRLEQHAGRSIVRGVVDSFLAEVPGRVERMRRAIAEGDAENLNFTAHVLKGSAAQLGARRLAEVCRELEDRSREESLEQAGELLRLLETEALRAREALLSRLRFSGAAESVTT
jgi:HPt (histidine-containing phosphotransfer) domain-containing protein